MITTDQLAPGRAHEVERLLTTVTAHDGVAPLDEAARLTLRDDRRRPGDQPSTAPVHLLVPLEDDDAHERARLAAYASVLPDGTVQGMVDPDHRRRGHGTALWERIRTLHVDPGVWAHGALAGSLAFLDGLGLRPARTLLTLERELDRRERELDSGSPPPPTPGAAVELTTFRADRDTADLLDVNARAFADHPEQGALDVEGLAARMAEDWFDPGDLHLARRAGALASFVWIKRAPGEDSAEVYVVATAPEAQGSGIGGMLLRRTLEDLAAQGVRTVELYVEADNAAALALYRRLGFREVARDVQFRTLGRVA